MAALFLKLAGFIPGIGPVISAGGAAWSFLTSPLGRVIGIAALAAGIWVHGDLHGASRVHEQWRNANLLARLKAAERDKSIATAIAAQAAGDNAQLETYAAALDRKVKDYALELQKRRDAACRLNRTDVERLLDIWRSRSRR